VGLVALFSVSLFVLARAVIPLAGIGLLLGMAGIVRASGKQQVWPGYAGALGCGLLLLVACFAPGLLGPVYESYRGSTRQDPNVVRVVTHAGRPQDPSDTPEGVDASRAGLQQGNLRVAVSAVTRLTIEPPKKSKEPARQYLVIRLRVEKTASGSDFASPQWTDQQRQEKPQVILTDNLGTAYTAQSVNLNTDETGRGHQSQVFPVAASDPVYVFNASPTGVESLTLEVPTSAWGGNATFKFTIPRSMLRSETQTERKP
jgi:hypothetical protein